jgi:hypothetical protein
MSGPPDKSIMRSLGEFCGHVLKGVKTDPAAPAPRVARAKVEEEVRETPAGRVVLRRTVIEEIVLPEGSAGPAASTDRAARTDRADRTGR